MAKNTVTAKRTGGKLHQTAEALHAYMTYRASCEGVGYTLTVGFFKNALRQGCVSFFGVQVRRGELVADHQQPELFAAWCKPRH